MKKFLILIILFIPFFNIHSFNFYYESIEDLNRESFLIHLNGPEDKKKFICLFKNLECEEKDISFSIYPKNFNNYLVAPNYEISLGQIKLSSKNFLTFYSEKNDNFFKILNFNKEIKKILGINKENILFESNGIFYIFSLNENKILKKFTLNKNKISFLTPSPSLKYLALYKYSSLNDGERKFLIFDTDNRTLKEFLVDKVNYWDLLTENNKLFDFISDDKLIFISDHQNFQTLYLYDILNNKIEKLFYENFIVKDFVIFGEKIFFIANKENPLKWDLFEYDFNKKEIKKIIDYVVYDSKLAIFNNYLIIKKALELPPQIYLLDLNNYELKRPKINNQSELIKYGEIRNYKNIWFAIFKPDNFQEKNENNLIIWLHGGPHRQTSLGYHPYFSYGVYDSLLEKLRENGAVIIKIDYPGSFGYGRNFAEILKSNIGKIDVDAIIEITQEIKKEIKIKKIYLIGNSYGGYLALKTLYEMPNLFSGAISINGVIDWKSLISNNPYSIFRIHFNGSPNKKNLKLYNQANLFFKKERLKGKDILLIYGEKDTTVPYKQNLIFKEKYQNIANILIEKLDENHIIKNKNNLEKILEKINFFINKP